MTGTLRVDVFAKTAIASSYVHGVGNTCHADETSKSGIDKLTASGVSCKCDSLGP